MPMHSNRWGQVKGFDLKVRDNGLRGHIKAYPFGSSGQPLGGGWSREVDIDVPRDGGEGSAIFKCLAEIERIIYDNDQVLRDAGFDVAGIKIVAIDMAFYTGEHGPDVGIGVSFERLDSQGEPLPGFAGFLLLKHWPQNGGEWVSNCSSDPQLAESVLAWAMSLADTLCREHGILVPDKGKRGRQ